ncbi:Tocopherol cyclase, chloroplastic [Sesamum angolense]|uniref:Tocopherol cyclase, chloroplastic n=1 Tax=Sesamum angolense TaxID=2727404 RepID=A0AAE1W8Q3_9LAMI|nr:Tocopherol cyclase, chloroplastic [Sesamum angolense]
MAVDVGLNGMINDTSLKLLRHILKRIGFVASPGSGSGACSSLWVQCNVFEGADGDVALTAGGGLRQVPGLSETFENAALIGVHYGEAFYEFIPWNGVVNWEIAPWGHWSISAENETYTVILDVTSNMAAVEVGGGGPCFTTWKGKTCTPEIVRRVVM